MVQKTIGNIIKNVADLLIIGNEQNVDQNHEKKDRGPEIAIEVDRVIETINDITKAVKDLKEKEDLEHVQNREIDTKLIIKAIKVIVKDHVRDQEKIEKEDTIHEIANLVIEDIRFLYTIHIKTFLCTNPF